jgi:hypothetical protein
MIGEVPHMPMVVSAQPFFQLRGFFFQKIRFRNATKVKAQALGCRFDQLGMSVGSSHLESKIGSFPLFFLVKNAGRGDYFQSSSHQNHVMDESRTLLQEKESVFCLNFFQQQNS